MSETRKQQSASLDQMVLDLSREFLFRYYQFDAEWCLARCAENLVFFGSTRNMVALDREDFSHKLARLARNMHPCVAGHIETLLLPAMSEDVLAVIARYLLASDPTTGYVEATYKRASLFWKLVDGTPLLVHLHASTPYDTTVSANPKPLTGFEHESYLYARTILGELQRRASVGIRDVSGTMHYVLPAEVRYLEASRQRSIIHCLSKDVVVRRGFGDLVHALGESLVVVHRSFAVNPLHVKAISHDTVVLDDGTDVPIPRRRAREVRTALEQAVAKAASEQALRETPPRATFL